MRRGKHNIDRETWLKTITQFTKRGEDLPQAKLKADDVKEIRKNRHGKTAKQLAELYGVHKNTIDKIRDFKSWIHI